MQELTLQEPAMQETAMHGAEWRLLLQLMQELRRQPRSPSAAARVCQRLKDLRPQPAHPLARAVYLPLIARCASGPLTLGQIGQSLDGQTATPSGHSHYINGPDALDHLHRLRALADAVLIGASTAVLDDPQLTTRRVEGPSPVRVIIDPRRRVPASARVFDAAAPTLVLHARGSTATGDAPGEGIALDADADGLSASAIIGALHERGLFTLLVEGGGTTLSVFLRAGCLQRLHVMAAPLLIGPGRPAFRLAAAERLDSALRFAMTAHPLGADVLLDCDLEGGGRAGLDREGCDREGCR